jgi:UDP-3-O-[3-hydroxymyristoyl] glucosamine N-acyltransferase
VVRVAEPYRAFAQALSLFQPVKWPAEGVHASAVVAEDAILGPGVCIEPLAIVQSGARLGEGCWLQGGSYVGAGAVLGERCRLMPGAVVMDGCTLGAQVWLNPGAVVGSEGFGFVPDTDLPVKIPQAGTVVIEDHVEIGANSCVDRAALGETRVGRGAKLDNLCQVGHGAEVGPANLLVAYAGIAGSSCLGRAVTLAARASVLGHLRIGDRVTVAGHSLVSKDVAEGDSVSGVPARPHAQWLRERAASRSLPEMVRAVQALQRQIESEGVSD